MRFIFRTLVFVTALFLSGYASACTGSCSTLGQMAFCTDTYKFCDGTNWVGMADESAGGSCSAAGLISYTSNSMQFCDGSTNDYLYCQSNPLNDGTCTDSGMMQVDVANTRMEFCNGTNWVVMKACSQGGSGPPPDPGTDNAIVCWGTTTWGDIGTGNDSGSPVTQPNVSVTFPTGVSEWSVYKNGFNGSCAIADTGDAYCWGRRLSGAIGDGGSSSGYQAEPDVAVVKPSGVTSWVDIGAGFVINCGLADTGDAYCWGNDNEGALGNGTTTTSNQDAPVIVDKPSGVSAYTDIAVGSRTACAIDTDGDLYCWGRNGAGGLGNGITGTNSDTPVAVTLPSGVSTWTKMTVGDGHTCAVADTGDAYCWGNDADGQLGDGDPRANSNTPQLVVKPSGVTSWLDITAGGSHSCGIGNNNDAYCWGKNQNGQVGKGGVSSDALFPTRVRELTSTITAWKQISANGNNSCAVASDDDLYCWGANSNGEVGNGTTGNTGRPVPVTSPSYVSSWSSVAVGIEHVCAMEGTGFVAP